MIGSTRRFQVFAFTRPADMRKGFEGLYALVSNEMKMSPLSGDLFLFVSKDRRRAKCLLWDGTGLCIFAKRLEQGRFADLWHQASVGPLQLTQTELSLFLEGCVLVGRIQLSPAPFDLAPAAP